MAHRSLSTSPFGKKPFSDGEGADPMAGMANLADVMLVFACGLMLAIVAYYNVDITPNLTEVAETENLVEIEQDIEDQDNLQTPSGSGYEELGVVYRDPDTGKLYMMKEKGQ